MSNHDANAMPSQNPSAIPWLVGCGIAGVLGVGVCGGSIYFFVVWVYALTQPVVDASEAFLAQLSQGKVAEAYASTAAGFREAQDEDSFAEGVDKLGLNEPMSVSWNSQRIRNQEGYAGGTATTKSGKSKPISVDLTWEDEKWKVGGVRLGGVDILSIRASLPRPPRAELEAMALETLLDFNEAIKAKDFAPFYEKISERWKKQISAKELQSTFQTFIDKELDISAIKNTKPEILDLVTANPDGLLEINGSYPTEPAPVGFELKYFPEKGRWKLFGIRVKVN